MRVGYIGLGSQGGPIAQRILDAGYPTTLWARREESLVRYRGSAARFATTPAELGAASDLVGLCVFDDADVEEMVRAVLPGMAAGSVIAVQSTVHPDTCMRLAALAAEGGVALVDAPVSGGPQAAESGTLAVMVGGDADAVARIRPVLATFGDPIVATGALGSAQAVKLLNNLLMAANLSLADDALNLAAAFGVDRDAFVQIVTKGSGNSFAFSTLARAGSFTQFAEVAAARLGKDIDIITALTDARDLPTGDVLAVAQAGLRRAGYPPPTT